MAWNPLSAWVKVDGKCFMNARDGIKTVKFQRFDVPCREWRVDDAVRIEIREARSGQHEDKTVSNKPGRPGHIGRLYLQGQGKVVRGHFHCFGTMHRGGLTS
jgi:hypothetical protein